MSDEKKEPSFEQIVARLETIAKQLESGQPKLEEALGLFEEGVRLGKQGHQQLDSAEKRLETLLDDGTTAPMASPGDDA
jgi:exodeoxyribonuclease VII small subunit